MIYIVWSMHRIRFTFVFIHHYISISFFFFFFLMIRRPPRSTLSLHDALPIFSGSINAICCCLLWTLLRTVTRDRKSTRLNSSHPSISYAVFCLKKKKKTKKPSILSIMSQYIPLHSSNILYLVVVCVLLTL